MWFQLTSHSNVHKTTIAKIVCCSCCWTPQWMVLKQSMKPLKTDTKKNRRIVTLCGSDLLLVATCANRHIVVAETVAEVNHWIVRVLIIRVETPYHTTGGCRNVSKFADKTSLTLNGLSSLAPLYVLYKLGTSSCPPSLSANVDESPTKMTKKSG